MNSVAFEPVMGASGDMILGALFDLGADPVKVAVQLRAAGLAGFTLRFFRTPPAYSRILYGRCEVTIEPDHGDGHDHGAHRHLDHILDFIRTGHFPIRAARRAEAIFQRLAEAEAAVHGIPVQEVHFHEVGATDAIVDVVGSCLALEQLAAEHVYCAPLKVGTGTIHCAHGILPNPAPATVRLLEGFQVIRLTVEAELTTPTGAAILTTLSEGDWSDINSRWIKTGSGHGTKILQEGPNILRAYLLETAPPQGMAEVMETDLDDETPEVLALLTESLLKTGALDVSLCSVQMKKGRPGVRLTIVAQNGDAARLANLIFSGSSTIGIRTWPVRRYLLPRTAATVSTPYGDVAVKRIERPGGIEFTPEYEACRKLAAETGTEVRQIMHAARRFEKKTGGI